MPFEMRNAQFCEIIILCMLGNFLSSAAAKSTCLKKSFMIPIRVSKSLDPGQAHHFVGPDLGPNCLQRLSADNTCRQRVKALHLCHSFSGAVEFR